MMPDVDCAPLSLTHALFFFLLSLSTDGSLAHCLEWPRAMEQVIAVAMVLSFDLLTESKLPCYVENFTYFTKVRVAFFTPLLPFFFVVCAAAIGAVVRVVMACRERRRINTITRNVKSAAVSLGLTSKSQIRGKIREIAGLVDDHEGQRVDAARAAEAAEAKAKKKAGDTWSGTSQKIHWGILLKNAGFLDTVGLGLWLVAPVCLQGIDLLFPFLTRTLLQTFACRDLGEAGSYLQADYGIFCDGDEYQRFKLPVIIFSVLYSLGIPAIFMWLLYKYEARAKAGDVFVRRALSFMYLPYREGKEWPVMLRSQEQHFPD